MEDLNENLPQQLSATSVEEVLELIANQKVDYPIIIAPWHGEGQKPQYIVRGETQLREAFEKALKDSSHDARVHVIKASIGTGRTSDTITETDN